MYNYRKPSQDQKSCEVCYNVKTNKNRCCCTFSPHSLYTHLRSSAFICGLFLLYLPFHVSFTLSLVFQSRLPGIIQSPRVGEIMFINNLAQILPTLGTAGIDKGLQMQEILEFMSIQ